jgi:hypothetical protein
MKVAVHVASAPPFPVTNRPATIFGLGPAIFYLAIGGIIALGAMISMVFFNNRKKKE